MSARTDRRQPLPRSPYVQLCDSQQSPASSFQGDCADRVRRVQVELLNRQRWRTRIELANALFECVEIFYNRRRHSSLGMLTPIE
jgi:putative transposase